MIRKIISIDEEKCNGCGLCADACHENAIAMINGKAKLIRDDYCDGLGDCLPVCPVGAITFVEREADSYDERAAIENKKKEMKKQGMVLPCGCPGSRSQKFDRDEKRNLEDEANTVQVSRLGQWPVQIKLVPVNAPYFENADLLISADCAAYSYGNFHNDFIKGKITIIGCPKLDDGDYSGKLTEIIKNNNIASLTIVRMEVPCCAGIERVAISALKNSGKFIPWQVVVISTDGRIISKQI